MTCDRALRGPCLECPITYDVYVNVNGNPPATDSEPPTRMNPQESALHYPLGDELPAPGTTRELAPGVRWLRLQLPFALDHINLWLLRDRIDGREGWTVVDCGIDRPETRAQWETVFATQLDGLPVLRVLVTHMHPDHVGLAHWICGRWSAPGQDCRLWMSSTDYFLARVGRDPVHGFGGEPLARFLGAQGLNAPETQQALLARPPYYPSLVPDIPRSYRRMVEGDSIDIGGHAWRCIGGRGHAPEHIALHCETLGLLIAGDMVLPRISTNVSVHEDEPEGNPLRDFLASIDKYLPLPPQTLVLPSHGKPFTGLQARIGQLHAHHADRLAEVMEACRQSPQSAADLLPLMFKRPLDLNQMPIAVGEALAHLHLLWHEGKLQRELDGEGVWRFRAAPAA